MVTVLHRREAPYVLPPDGALLSPLSAPHARGNVPRPRGRGPLPGAVVLLQDIPDALQHTTATVQVGIGVYAYVYAYAALTIIIMSSNVTLYLDIGQFS